MPVKRKTKAKVTSYIVKKRKGGKYYLNDAYSDYSSSGSSRSSIISNYSMDSAGGSSTQGAVNNEAKKRKLHEAQLIPGLAPGKQWGFPNSIITKHRYAALQSMASSAGSLVRHAWSANSIYDPDFTGTGHQPLYFDQYAAIYDQYVVLGAKITITFANRDTAKNAIIGIVGEDDGTASPTIDTLMECNNSVSTILPPAGAGTVEMSLTYEPQEAFGVDAKADGFSQTSVGTSPTEGYYWVMFHIPADGTSTQTCDCKIEIEYTVKYSELKTPVQS